MIFVDCGSYHANFLEQVVNWGQLHADLHNSSVYSFEPNAKMYNYWKVIKDRHIRHLKDIQFINKAVWVKDTTISYTETADDIGGTVMGDKTKFNNIIKVESIDFSNWIKQFNEPILIKMNIEGAEYPVLEKMIQDGTDKLVDILFVEFHAKKMDNKDYWLNKELSIKKHLGNKLYDWR